MKLDDPKVTEALETTASFMDRYRSSIYVVSGLVICGSAIALNHLQGSFTPIHEAATLAFMMGLVALFNGMVADH